MRTPSRVSNSIAVDVLEARADQLRTVEAVAGAATLGAVQQLARLLHGATGEDVRDARHPGVEVGRRVRHDGRAQVLVAVAAVDAAAQVERAGRRRGEPGLRRAAGDDGLVHAQRRHLQAVDDVGGGRVQPHRAAGRHVQRVGDVAVRVGELEAVLAGVHLHAVRQPRRARGRPGSRAARRRTRRRRCRPPPAPTGLVAGGWRGRRERPAASSRWRRNCRTKVTARPVTRMTAKAPAT